MIPHARAGKLPSCTRLQKLGRYCPTRTRLVLTGNGTHSRFSSTPSLLPPPPAGIQQAGRFPSRHTPHLQWTGNWVSLLLELQRENWKVVGTPAGDDDYDEGGEGGKEEIDRERERNPEIKGPGELWNTRVSGVCARRQKIKKKATKTNSS